MKKVFTLFCLLCSFFAYSQSTTLVISQVFGGGGNSGAAYNADFVEIKNISSAPINLSGYSVQYASATATAAWSGVFALPAATIPAGGYYLVQMSAAGATGAALPTPDAVATPAINMSGSNGRVAIVNGTTALNACPTTAVDIVGFGTSVCFEGSAPTAALTVSPNPPRAAIRKNNGCTDSNNNLNDFDVLDPTPRNSASSPAVCGAVAPALAVSPTSLAFGNADLGTTSASQTFSVSGSNLTGAPGNITVTAPSANFQVSLDNSSWSSSVSVPYTSATLSGTTVYVQFVPQNAGGINGNISVSGGGAAAAVTVALSGTGVALVPALSASAPAGFGSVCINTASAEGSFTLSGTYLTNADITVGPLANYKFATVAGGPYSNQLTLSQAGGTYSQTVYISFTPTAVQSYDATVPVSGGGAAASLTVPVTGAGVNSAPGVTTGTATNITTFTALLAGNVTSTGCSALTSYGIEYSTSNGFANGAGTKISASNLASGAFSATLAGLDPSTTYYYKAYAENAGGITYGAQRSFTTLICFSPTVVTETASASNGYHEAVVRGTVSDTGCSAVSSYGIEYSGISGFATGTGKKVAGASISSGTFSVQLSNLIQNSTYYFRAYAINRGGIAYGDEQSFVTKAVPAGLVIYSVPAQRGQQLHFSLDKATRGHYNVQLINAAGQVVFKKDILVQQDFIDTYFAIPSAIQPGVYTFSLIPDNAPVRYKSILIQ